MSNQPGRTDKAARKAAREANILRLKEDARRQYEAELKRVDLWEAEANANIDAEVRRMEDEDRARRMLLSTPPENSAKTKGIEDHLL